MHDNSIHNKSLEMIEKSNIVLDETAITFDNTPAGIMDNSTIIAAKDIVSAMKIEATLSDEGG